MVIKQLIYIYLKLRARDLLLNRLSVWCTESRAARFDLEGSPIQFVVVQQQRRVQQICGDLGDVVDFVRRLLEVADLANNVGHLRAKSFE